jgi:hypothetical protein
VTARSNISKGQFGPRGQVQEYEGAEGNRDHITRSEIGLMPTAALVRLHGARGEKPGEHEHYQGAAWDEFKSRIAPGIEHDLFITVDHGDEPRISEGNNRRDAAVELGHPYVPVEVRYFGHAERQGTVFERHLRGDTEPGQ